jgi:hypothetical protein
MRTVKTNAKQVIVSLLRVGIVCCLFTSAVALGLLATNESAERSLGIALKKAEGGKTIANPQTGPNTFEADPGIGPNTFEVLSYQDSSPYRFLRIGENEAPPPGFEQPGFDETSFPNVGNAPFGFDCSLESKITTDWPINTQLLVRRHVSIQAGDTNVRVMVSVDNDIRALFFNGTLIAENLDHEGCAIPGEATFRIDVPQEVNGRKVVQLGDNVVAYWLRDRGGGSFFDTQILVERALEQQVNQLKVDTRQAPLVPVSDVKLLCRVDPNSERTSTTISYVVSGTKELGKITIEQDTSGALTVESLLSGNRMAAGTITSNNATMSRSPLATQKIANLDPGVLSVGSVLLDETALARLFRCIATPVGAALSCQEQCDLKAEKMSATARILNGFIEGGAVTTQLKPFSAYTGDYLSRAADSRTIPKIELLRQQCRSLCPPLPQCSDGLDNDADGKTDYPTDPGCSSPDDNSESPNPPPPQCSDGLDNDGDKKIDYPADPGCSSPDDNSENSDQPREITSFCFLDKFIPLQGGIPYYLGTCGGGLIQGTVIRIENANNFPIRFLNIMKTNSDCNNPQFIVDVNLRGTIDATGLQKLFGTSRPRLPLGVVLCGIPGVQPGSQPDRITINLILVP